MKLFVASLLVGGGTFLAADLPAVDDNECSVVSVTVETPEPTLIDPDPAADAMKLVVYCGHRVPSGENGSRVERALKVIDVDVDTAEVIVNGAADLLDGDQETATF